MLRRTFLALCLTLAVSLTLSGLPTYYPAALGDFGGVSDYLLRSSDLDGNVDGKTGILSAWLRIDGGDAALQYVVTNGSFRFMFARQADNTILVRGRGTDGNIKLQLTSAGTYTASVTWLHLLASWDLSATAGHLYINDTSDLAGGSTLLDVEIDYTRTTWGLGASTTPSDYFNGAISELYFTNEYIDFSVKANRRFFIDPSGYPVYLGADGSLPTGTAPLVYMRERANNCGINSGTGGDFVIQGAPLHTDGPVPFVPLPTLIPKKRGRGSRIH